MSENGGGGQIVPVVPGDGGPPATRPERPENPRESERTTRKPLGWWDRTKFLILFAVAWLIIVWATYVEFEGLITVGDAFQRALRSGAWLIVLFGIEVLRQIHFAISERSERYHYFWTHRVFKRADGIAKKVNPWTRYRVSRALKWAFVLILADVVVAKLTSTSAFTAFATLPARLVTALPFAFQLVVYMFILIAQFGMLFWFLSRGGSDVILPEEVETRFSDIKGQDAVLERVKDNVIFLEKPDLIEAHGGTVPKGILLWGPPGTGKTMMAKAVAGETSKPFISVDPGAFIQMFMGVGILKVKALFRKARKLALRYGGVIMFFDEVDSLGNRGVAVGGNWYRRPENSPWAAVPRCNGMSYLSPGLAGMLVRDAVGIAQPAAPTADGVIAGLGGFGGGGGMGTLQALLGELDGMDKPRGFFNRRVRRLLGMRPKPPPKYRILTIMATNLPDVLDPAMLRPGRIDRIYKVGYPSKNGRLETFRKYLQGKSHNLTDEDLEKLATITAYYGGAAIEDLVNAALINAITEGRDAIGWRDIVKAKQVKDLGLPDDVEYVERERHATAVHEACHAVVAYRFRRHLNIDIATIEKSGDYLGVVTNIPPEELFTDWRSEIETDVMVSLASLAGEKMFFEGDSSSGVSSDLDKATITAVYMEGYWGMGSTIASHGALTHLKVGPGLPTPGPGPGTDKETNPLEGMLGRRIELKLAELLRRTEETLSENRLEVLAVAHALEANKTITGDDVGAIVDGRQGPLIDGRPYHAPGSREALEAYHVVAVAAHRQHAKIEAPLPTMRPFEPAVPVAAPNGDLSDGSGHSPGEAANGDGAHPPVAIGDGSNRAPAPPRPDAQETDGASS